MDLYQMIKETEQLGITVLFCSMPISKGRYDNTLGKPCIYLDKDLSDIEKINILLHERSHHINNDQQSSLTYISHRIESQAEKDRIADFLTLINQEYPLDETFNYLEYMRQAQVPPRFEGFVKELATKLYHENRTQNSL